MGAQIERRQKALCSIFTAQSGVLQCLNGKLLAPDGREVGILALVQASAGSPGYSHACAT
jgi:hypothetical protein